MNPHEIVPDGVQGEGMPVVLQFLAEGVGQPGKPAARHSGREVMPLDIRGRDIAIHRGTHDRFLFNPDARCWTIAVLRVVRLPIQFNEHGIVNIRPKRILYRLQVGFMTIRGELDPIRKPCFDIPHKDRCGITIPVADQPRDE